MAFTTERPTPYLPLLLAKSWVSPTHLFDKYGPEWATRPETHFGSGPYRLVEWIKGDRIVLGINENYRGPTRPMLERVVSRLYNLAVPPQFLSAYEAGEVDYVPLTNQAEINRIKADPMLRDQLNAYTDFATYYLMLDTYNPPFDDVRVRKAFAHAIDVEAIIKSAMRDVGIPASSMLPPGFPGSSSEELAPLQRFDPELARRYLAEAGYPGGRGFPEVNIWLRGEAANIRTAAEAVQAMLNQHLALDVGVRNVERKVYLDAMSARELTIGMVPYQYDFIDAGNLLTIWLSNGRHAWHNDRFERLVRQANELVGDPVRRMAMYRDAERILVDEAGGIFLWYIRINQIWKPFVRGASLEPNQWGYRAWRGELMSNLQTNLYITRDVFEDPHEKETGALPVLAVADRRGLITRSPVSPRVPVYHPFHFILVQPGKGSTLEHGVQAAQVPQRIVYRRDRVVGAEEQLVPYRVFLDEHETVIELKGTVVQSGNIGIYVGMLADDRHGFAFVGMAEMGHDDPAFGEPDGDRVQVPGQGAVQRRLVHERGSGVQQDG